MDHMEEIKKAIVFHGAELRKWRKKLADLMEHEYQARRSRNLEVESDRKDFERADKALEKLRESKT